MTMQRRLFQPQPPENHYVPSPAGLEISVQRKPLPRLAMKCGVFRERHWVVGCQNGLSVKGSAFSAFSSQCRSSASPPNSRHLEAGRIFHRASGVFSGDAWLKLTVQAIVKATAAKRFASCPHRQPLPRPRDRQSCGEVIAALPEGNQPLVLMVFLVMPLQPVGAVIVHRIAHDGMHMVETAPA